MDRKRVILLFGKLLLEKLNELLSDLGITMHDGGEKIDKHEEGEKLQNRKQKLLFLRKISDIWTIKRRPQHNISVILDYDSVIA